MCAVLCIAALRAGVHVHALTLRRCVPAGGAKRVLTKRQFTAARVTQTRTVCATCASAYGTGCTACSGAKCSACRCARRGGGGCARCELVHVMF